MASRPLRLADRPMRECPRNTGLGVRGAILRGRLHPPLQVGWLQEVTHAETIPRVAARPCSGGSRSGRDWRYGVLSSVISMDRCNYDSGMARPTLLPPNCPLTL